MTTTINNITIFNPLNHGVNNQPLMVPADEYNKLLSLAVKLNNCIRDMRDEHKIHGHITDASANYMVNIKPEYMSICLPNAKDEGAAQPLPSIALLGSSPEDK